MAKRKWPKAQDGEWIQPRMREYRMKCCDCGLVHVLRFRVIENNRGNRRKVQFQAFRDERCTAASRREAKKKAVEAKGE